MNALKKYEINSKYALFQFLHAEAGAKAKVVEPTNEACNAIRVIFVTAKEAFKVYPNEMGGIRCFKFESDDGTKFENRPVPLFGEKLDSLSRYTITHESSDETISLLDARYAKEAFKDNPKIMGMIKQVEDRYGVTIGFNVRLDGSELEGKPARAARYSFELEM